MHANNVNMVLKKEEIDIAINKYIKGMEDPDVTKFLGLNYPQFKAIENRLLRKLRTRGGLMCLQNVLKGMSAFGSS